MCKHTQSSAHSEGITAARGIYLSLDTHLKVVRKASMTLFISSAFKILLEGT